MTFACPPPPPMTADNQLVETDYNGLSPTNDLSMYRDLFFSVPLLGEIIDYANINVFMREDLWDEFDYAESFGSVRSIARPADYPPDPWQTDTTQSVCYLTTTEAKKNFVTKLAHAMYHEVHNTFPWSIRDYDEEELRDLVDPDRLYQGWALEAPLSGSWQGCVDYSPNVAYDKMVANACVPASTAKEAVANITENIGKTLRHVSGGDPRDVIDITDWFDDRNKNGTLYISRQGCPTSSYLAVALARSVNIPGATTIGYYSSGWHTSANFKSVDYVLSHGDHFYNAYMTSATEGRLYHSYADYVANIYTYPPADPAVEGLTKRRHYDIAMTHVTDFMLDSFAYGTSGGWPSQYAAMSPWYTAEEMATHYRNLVALTGTDGGGGPVPP